jgi:hypothetical protein
MRSLLLVGLFAALTGVGPQVWAADVAVFPVSLTQGPGGKLVIAPKQAITLKAGQDQPIDVKCGTAMSPVDCTQYSLEYAKKDGSGAQSMSPGTITKADAQWTLTWAVVSAVDKCNSGEVIIAPKSAPAGAAPNTITIDVSVPADPSCAAAAPPAPGGVVGAGKQPPPNTDTTQLTQLLTTDCTDTINQVLAQFADPTQAYDPNKVYRPDPMKFYDEAGNAATFIVTATGNVVARPPEIVDENDVVNVIVIVDHNLLGTLKVTRSSAIRTLGTNFLGSSATVPSAFLKAGGCEAVRASLGDFNAGKGEVTIAAQITQGSTPGSTTTGTFEFNVDTLYSGAFSLGPMYTTVKSPTFGLVGKGSSNVVTETDKAADRVIVALVYTPYVWGRRDPEKEYLHSIFDYHRLNPMFGIVLNDVTNNAIVGLSYNLSSMIYLNMGAHFGKVKNIDPNSGLAVGSTFTGTGTSVPTQTQWKTGFFVGFSMDLTAAAKFFGLASAPAKSQ